MKKLLALIMLSALSLSFFACSSDSSDNSTGVTTDTLSATVKEIPADTAKLNQLTYFSLRENKIIDSTLKNTTDWDVAFSASKIYVNCPASGGTGIGEAQVLKSQDYASLVEAPANGYRADSSATNLAITTGSGNGWYSYNGDTHEITPIAGVVLVIKTADGKYAKMQILSYYKGYLDNTMPTTVADRRDRMYTFKYFLQKDGSRNLK